MLVTHQFVAKLLNRDVQKLLPIKQNLSVETRFAKLST